MLLKPENSTDTNELFECHGEYDVYQYNHGYGDVYKATIRISGYDRKSVWELTGISFVIAAVLAFAFFKTMWSHLDKQGDQS